MKFNIRRIDRPKTKLQNASQLKHLAQNIKQAGWWQTQEQQDGTDKIQMKSQNTKIPPN